MSKNREPIEQNIHDTVITDLVEKLQKQEHNLKVRTNPGVSKKYPYPVRTGDKVYYPDIYTYEDDKVKEIFEVETENTVNEDSIEQWRLYSLGSAKFYLVVPKESEQKAKELVKRHNIDVAGYWVY